MLPRSRFTEDLVRLNRLSFRRWLVEPGMPFLAGEKWWGDRGARARAHNGLDLLWYESGDGARAAIDTRTRVPLLYGGRIVRVFEDFLGFTIAAAHEAADDGCRLCTLCGHVVPGPGVVAGAEIPGGHPVASLAGAGSRGVPSHLHLSAALLPRDIDPAGISWGMLDTAPGVRFLDPARLIEPEIPG